MLTRATRGLTKTRGLTRAIPKFTRSLLTSEGTDAWQKGRANVAQKTSELEETEKKAFESKYTALIDGYKKQLESAKHTEGTIGLNQGNAIRLSQATLIGATKRAMDEHIDVLTPSRIQSIISELTQLTKAPRNVIKNALSDKSSKSNSGPSVPSSSGPSSSGPSSSGPSGSSSSSSSSNSGPSSAKMDWEYMALIASALAAGGYAVVHKSDEKKEKEESAKMKSELENLIKITKLGGLIDLDTEIYVALSELKGSTLDTHLPGSPDDYKSIRYNLILFRDGLANIPLSDIPAQSAKSKSYLANARCETVGDALKLMQEFRIAIGSATPVTKLRMIDPFHPRVPYALRPSYYSAKYTEEEKLKMPGGKNLYDLVQKFQGVFERAFYHPSYSISGPIERVQLKGGRRRRSRRRTNKRKTRKNRK